MTSVRTVANTGSTERPSIHMTRRAISNLQVVDAAIFSGVEKEIASQVYTSQVFLKSETGRMSAMFRVTRELTSELTDLGDLQNLAKCTRKRNVGQK